MPDSLNGGYWTLLDEVTEIDGGRSCARPALAKAVLLCRLDGAKLIVAKMDMPNRKSSLLTRLTETGVSFVDRDQFCSLLN